MLIGFAMLELETEDAAVKARGVGTLLTAGRFARIVLMAPERGFPVDRVPVFGHRDDAFVAFDGTFGFALRDVSVTVLRDQLVILGAIREDVWP